MEDYSKINFLDHNAIANEIIRIMRNDYTEEWQCEEVTILVQLAMQKWEDRAWGE